MKHQNRNSRAGSQPDVNDRVIVDANNGLLAKPYETPTLIAYGDVRDITLGGTIGFGESGAGFENTAVPMP